MEIQIALAFSPEKVIENLGPKGDEVYRALDSAGADAVRDAAKYIIASRPDLGESVRYVLQSEFGISLSGDPSSYIKLAADSVAKLRQSDVYRVLESAGKKDAPAVAQYIIKQRPDLADEIREVMVEELGLQFKG